MAHLRDAAVAVPTTRRGEDFGLHAMVGKLATGFAPHVAAGRTILLVTELLELSRFEASRVAVFVLAGSALAGFLVLHPLRDPG